MSLMKIEQVAQKVQGSLISERASQLSSHMDITHNTRWVLLYIYIYAFSRRFYPKRLTVHSGYTFFCQYMCSLAIEPTTFALLPQCSNQWATGTLYHIYSSWYALHCLCSCTCWSIRIMLIVVGKLWLWLENSGYSLSSQRDLSRRPSTSFCVCVYSALEEPSSLDEVWPVQGVISRRG